MRYVTNSDNYLQAVSFGADIECGGRTCREYTGGIPVGYDSLEAWYAAECETLCRWKVIEDELVLDSSVDIPATYAQVVETGAAEIEYKMGVTEVTVEFCREYIEPPAVFISSVFSSGGLVVMADDITTRRFTARLPGGFSESGMRRFNWLAIGLA